MKQDRATRITPEPLSASQPIDGAPHSLVGAETLLEKLFPEERDRPSLRWLRKLQAQRLIPYKKVGRLVRFSVSEVRAALDRQFTIAAR